MRKLINHLLVPLFILLFVGTVNHNTAHIGGGYELDLLESNGDSSSHSCNHVAPYSEIPCDYLYKIWDNHRIHAYNFQRWKMKDTACLVMGYEPCDFEHPRQGYVTSDFGHREGGYHYGIDIKLRTGQEVKAAFEGMVRVSRYSSSYGHVVVVRHNNGLETLYAHLSKRKVQVGDYVQAGDIVGLGGNTGRSTGSHLHFETRYLGEPINPNKIIDFKTGTLKNDTIFLTKYNFNSAKNVLKKKSVKKKVSSKSKPVIKPAKPVAKSKAVNKSVITKTKSSGKKKYHLVKSGNTLYSLARANGVTVQQLRKWNNIKGNNIKVGTRIQVR